MSESERIPPSGNKKYHVLEGMDDLSDIDHERVISFLKLFDVEVEEVHPHLLQPQRTESEAEKQLKQRLVSDEPVLVDLNDLSKLAESIRRKKSLGTKVHNVILEDFCRKLNMSTHNVKRSEWPTNVEDIDMATPIYNLRFDKSRYGEPVEYIDFVDEVGNLNWEVFKPQQRLIRTDTLDPEHLPSIDISGVQTSDQENVLAMKNAGDTTSKFLHTAHRTFGNPEVEEL